MKKMWATVGLWAAMRMARRSQVWAVAAVVTYIRKLEVWVEAITKR